MKKLKIEKGGNDSLSIEHKEEIQDIYHKSLDLISKIIIIIIIIIHPGPIFSIRV